MMQLDLFAAPPPAPPPPPFIAAPRAVQASAPPSEDFASLYGNEVPRRALEIALVGGHSIALVGPVGSGQRALVSAASRIGRIEVFTALVGGGPAMDLNVETHVPRDCDRQVEMESSATIAERVAAAQALLPTVPCELDEGAAKLMDAAAAAMQLDRQAINRVWRVAMSIAALAGHNGPQRRIHVAEALSYARPIASPAPPEPEPQDPAPNEADDDDPHGITACQRAWVGDGEVVEVGPERLEFERGDIANSYSADTLAMEGRTRKPFQFRGALWVNTGGWSHRGKSALKCYRIVSVEQFDGPHAPYSEHDWVLARAGGRDNLGSYHGMSAEQGGREIVLQGPPIIVVSGQPEQAALL